MWLNHRRNNPRRWKYWTNRKPMWLNHRKNNPRRWKYRTNCRPMRVQHLCKVSMKWMLPIFLMKRKSHQVRPMPSLYLNHPNSYLNHPNRNLLLTLRPSRNPPTPRKHPLHNPRCKSIISNPTIYKTKYNDAFRSKNSWWV